MLRALKTTTMAAGLTLAAGLMLAGAGFAQAPAGLKKIDTVETVNLVFAF